MIGRDGMQDIGFTHIKTIFYLVITDEFLIYKYDGSETWYLTER